MMVFPIKDAAIIYKSLFPKVDEDFVCHSCLQFCFICIQFIYNIIYYPNYSTGIQSIMLLISSSASEYYSYEYTAIETQEN